MGNKQKQKKPTPPNVPPTYPRKPDNPDSGRTIATEYARQIHGIQEVAEKGKEAEDIYAVQASAPPPAIDLQAVWKAADHARQLLDIQRNRLEKDVGKADAARERYEAMQESLQADQSRIQEERSELGSQRQKLADDHKEFDASARTLNDRERAVVERELAADAGFEGRNREALSGLNSEARELRALLSATRKRVADEEVEWDRRLAERRTECERKLELLAGNSEKAIQQRRSAIDSEFREERKGLDVERDGLKGQRSKIKADTEILAEDRQDFEYRVEIKVQAVADRLRVELTTARAIIEQTRADRDLLQTRLEERERADARFGLRKPEEIISNLERLESERITLIDELANRPSQADAARLVRLEAEHHNWDSERGELKMRVAELEAEGSRHRTGVIQMETLRDQNEALEVYKKVLRAEIDELDGQVVDLTKKIITRAMFPACTSMDEDAELNTRPNDYFGPIRDLTRFAKDIRNRIADADLNDANPPLYYGDRDIRLFIAGLAMSRLHILQGISGTGKTSLPLAFARAIGGGQSVIEVQAGWRDRFDLIGHFNSFRQEFKEEKFLQALYRARCPGFADRPYIIVLDEMNLSRPEQYFAVMLSALERSPEERMLELMSSPIQNPPSGLERDGRHLKIPANVWFVGTANHDETTLEFAPKTYDRSHVMELPCDPVPFTPPAAEYRPPVSYSALQDAFVKATMNSEWEHDAVVAFAALNRRLKGVLQEQFKIGWGNRLKRHMSRFIPVVRATGGNIAEAVDHIVATKLLRTLPARYENDPEDLRKLQLAVEQMWTDNAWIDEPMESLAIIRSALKEWKTRVGSSAN